MTVIMPATIKSFSQRSAFTGLMTFLATLTGTAYGVYEFHDQSDLIADIIKISGLLAIVSLCVSYLIWTLTHLKKAKDGLSQDSNFRGGLAGLLTGLAIVPVPYFTSTFKTEVLRMHNLEGKGIILSVLEAMPLSLLRGVETFQIISKVSLAAVISSVILGVIIAKTFPPRQRR